jgi:photosystem II stability/assembly factor-like uncharacterized protein
MKHLILFSAILCGLASSVAGQVMQQINSAPPAQGWVPLTSGVTYGLNYLSLVGRDTVYASQTGGAGLPIRSTNGGTTWEQFVAAPAAGKLKFTDSLNGFLCGSTDTVYLTSNGGASWQAAFTGLPGGLGPDAMVFESRDSGWVTAGANIGRTTDGGKTWVASKIHNGKCIAFADSKHGYIMGALAPWLNPPRVPAAAFQRTTDGGQTWNLIYAGPSWDGVHSGVTKDVYGIFAITPDTLLAVGEAIAMSVDSGNNWDTIVYQGDGYNGLISVFFPDHIHGTAVGFSGWIFHTSDAGLTWQRQVSPYPGNLGAVVFADSNNGYACGGQGAIIKTTNGGISWVDITPHPNNHIQGTVFPQPANSTASLAYTLPEFQHVSITLNEITGAELRSVLSNASESVGSQVIEISTESLPSGTYMYVLQSEKYYSTGKIEVIH